LDFFQYRKFIKSTKLHFELVSFCAQSIFMAVFRFFISYAGRNRFIPAEEKTARFTVMFLTKK